MPLTCPACKKASQSGPVCERCGCELSALHAVQFAAGVCLNLAHHYVSYRLWAEALEAAERSWQLQHSAEAARCAFLVAGALGNTPAALLWHQRARTLE
jgi:hypothetical protein